MSQFSEHFGWVEIVLTATVGLGFGVYQLWSVNREIARDKEAKERAVKQGTDADAETSASRPGHPVGEHELDDR